MLSFGKSAKVLLLNSQFLPICGASSPCNTIIRRLRTLGFVESSALHDTSSYTARCSDGFNRLTNPALPHFPASPRRCCIVGAKLFNQLRFHPTSLQVHESIAHGKMILTDKFRFTSRCVSYSISGAGYGALPAQPLNMGTCQPAGGSKCSR
jgi:hypothetical protein